MIFQMNDLFWKLLLTDFNYISLSQRLDISRSNSSSPPDEAVTLNVQACYFSRLKPQYENIDIWEWNSCKYIINDN